MKKTGLFLLASAWLTVLLTGAPRKQPASAGFVPACTVPAGTGEPGALAPRRWLGHRLTILAFVLLLSAVACTQPSPPPTTIPPTVTAAPTATPLQTAMLQQTTPLPPEFVWKITGGPNPFNESRGVAVAPNRDVYVLDMGNSRVQKFDSSGKFLLMWGSMGSGNGQFRITDIDAGKLAIDTQGNVFVTDTQNYRIQKFDSNGNYLTQWGTNGSLDGQFLYPADIAIDKNNNIYVGDYYNNTVQKFDDNGRFLLRWGSTGTQDGEFHNIYSVATDPQGNILVTDEALVRIQKFNSNGIFLSKISVILVENHLVSIYVIAVDSQGNIYIADHGNVRIVKLDSQGKILAVWNGTDMGAGKFSSLEDITVDEQGNIYIADSLNNLVYKFRQPGFRP